MFDSDSESSASFLSPNEDENYSVGEDDFDDDEEEASVFENDAIRKGFSLCPNATANSPGTPGADKTLFATQPASQSSILAPGTRRISPRRRSPAGITSAIVNKIRGDPSVMDSLAMAIPKKPKFQQQKEQHHDADPQPQTNENPKQQDEKRPMKKRKVSLSPTESLFRQRSRLETEDVIELLADDEDDALSEAISNKEQPPVVDNSTPRSNQEKPKSDTKVFSPSLLAAAKKQQQEHIAETKQKLKNEGNNNVRDNPTETSALVAHTEGSKQKKDKGPTKSKLKESKKEGSDSKPKAQKAHIDNSKQTAKKTSKKSSTKATTKKSKTKESESSLEASSESVKSLKALGATKSNTTTAPSHKVTKATKVAVSIGDRKARKTKKAKKTTFEDELLQKMFLTCRPYSVKDLIQLMGKTTSEASINFCLLSLVDKHWVIKKEFSSSKGTRTKELYWANQDSKDSKLWSKDCLQLPSGDAIRETRLELANLQQQQKTLHKEIEVVEKTPSNMHLSKLCEIAEQEVNDLSSKLDGMKDRIARGASANSKNRPGSLGGSEWNRNRMVGFQNRKPQPKKPMTPIQLKKKINAMRDEWIARKRKCMDFVDQLADGMEKKVKDVLNKVLELETDESENVSIPPKHEI